MYGAFSNHELSWADIKILAKIGPNGLTIAIPSFFGKSHYQKYNKSPKEPISRVI